MTDFADVRVLVIEDNELNGRLIEVYLQAMGVGHVDRVLDGASGLARVAACNPDLVVLDLMMPGLDGFEVCSTLRARVGREDLPILVQTALADAGARNRVFDIGADDLVLKPLDRKEFTARVRLLLENRRLLRVLHASRQRRDRELALAAATQQALLPTPAQLDAVRRETGVRVEALFRTSSELGGDLWGLHRLDGDRFAVFLADFTGHGVTAALNVFRLHTLMAALPRCDDPAEVLRRLNAALYPLLPTGQFATMLHAVVEPSQGHVRYAAAAAPAPIAGGRLHDGSGLPLGIVRDATFETRTLPLAPGSPVLFHSDALTETPCLGDGTPLSEAAVAARIAEVPDAALGPLLEPLLARLPETLPDDLTVVRLEIPPGENDSELTLS